MNKLLLQNLRKYIEHLRQHFELSHQHAILCLFRKIYIDRLKASHAPELFAVHPEPLPMIDIEIILPQYNLFELNQAYCSLLNDQKEKGSYYSPKELVSNCWTRVLEDFTCEFPTICDPSCGTGVFLLYYLEKSPEPIRCAETQLFGVDIDPFAVEICRWNIYAATGGKASPAAIINNIQCGNALIGLGKKELSSLIPISHYTPSENDSKKIARQLRKQHRKQLHHLENTLVSATKSIADLYYAIALWPKNTTAVPTQYEYQRLQKQSLNIALTKQQQQQLQFITSKYALFHWPLRFPSIFAQGGFDIIIGNPPYLDSEQYKKAHSYERQLIAEEFQSASGNWDLFVPFVERSLQILRSNGRMGLITPQKIIASDYCVNLQKLLLEKNWREVHLYEEQSFFDNATVSVAISIISNSSSNKESTFQYWQWNNDKSTQITVNLWSLQSLPAGFLTFPLRSNKKEYLQLIHTSQTLESIATISDSASTNEAYRIKSIVRSGSIEDKDNSRSFLLVNTGTIDPFELLWGEKRCRYLGIKTLHPILSSKLLKKQFPKRFKQASQRTVAVAGLGTQLEAVVLPPKVLSGKSTVLLQPHPNICPYALCALLNSSCYQEIYRSLFGTRGFGKGSMSIGPRQLEQMPIPPSDELQSQTQLSILGKKLSRKRTNKHLKLLNQTVEALFGLPQ